MTVWPQVYFRVPENVYCEKTELSGIVDRSHKATVTRRYAEITL